MTNTLYYVYDPMCAWCYAFKPTFEEIIKQLPTNVKIEFIPGGLAPHSDEPMPMQMREKIESIWYDITNIVGTKFNHAFWKECTPRRSTYLACQATLAAKKQNKEYEMICGIQEAYYLKAKNPSDEETLVDIAKELNLDIDRFKEDLYSKEILEEFDNKLNVRRKLRMNSFPSMAVKYKKEVYPINIKYNDPQIMSTMINNLVTNIYF